MSRLVCVVLACMLFVAVVLAGDPNCQSGYIHNPYNNYPAPRRVAVKAVKQVKNAVEKSEIKREVQDLATATISVSPATIDPSTVTPASTTTPASTIFSPTSTSPPVSSPVTATAISDSTVAPGTTSTPQTSLTPVSQTPTPIFVSTTLTPTTFTTTNAPATTSTATPTTTAPTTAPTTTTAPTVGPTPTSAPQTSCLRPIYSDDPTPGIKWNGYNTLQVFTCTEATNVLSMVASYKDAYSVARTASLTRFGTSFTATLAYPMLKVQNVTITVTFSDNSISTSSFANNQENVDFLNVYYNQTVAPTTVPGPVSNVSQLVRNVTNYDLFLGPHNNDARESRCFFPSYITANTTDYALSCQIDCLTAFTWSGNVSNTTVNIVNQPIFNNCTNRYYTYGSHISQGCINPAMAGSKLASVALNICAVINQCTLVIVPPSQINDLTAFVLSGNGGNTFNGSRCAYDTTVAPGTTLVPGPTATSNGTLVPLSGSTSLGVSLVAFMIALLSTL